MNIMEIEGTDYLNGDEVPVSRLNLITAEKESKYSKEFAEFAALFARKYGVACRGKPPILLTDESLETIRNYYASGLNIQP